MESLEESERRELESAHKRSSNHRRELEMSSFCGCFYCCQIVAVEDVKEWIDDGNTALCPKCGIDAVIGSASGHWPRIGFLHRMHARWFEAAT